MKIWAIDVSIDLKRCDTNVIKSKEKLQDYVIQLCKKANIDKQGDCIISQFNNHERQSIQFFQTAQFGMVSGYFVIDENVGHINVFSECPFDINIFIAFTKEFFGTEDTYVRRDNKFIE